MFEFSTFYFILSYFKFVICNTGYDFDLNQPTLTQELLRTFHASKNNSCSGTLTLGPLHDLCYWYHTSVSVVVIKASLIKFTSWMWTTCFVSSSHCPPLFQIMSLLNLFTFPFHTYIFPTFLCLFVNLSLRVQTSRKLWTCLCGNMLFFFNEKKDTDVSNQRDLGSCKGQI